MKGAPGWPLLILLAAPAAGDLAGAPPHQLGEGAIFIAEFEREVARCRLAAQPPDYCRWIDILKAVGAGRDAGQAIAGSFAIPAPVAEKLAPIARMYAPFLIERFTEPEMIRRFADLPAFTVREIFQPEVALVQSILSDSPQVLRTVVESRLKPAERAFVRRIGAALRELFEKMGLAESLQRFLTSDEESDWSPNSRRTPEEAAEERKLADLLAAFSEPGGSAGREALRRAIALEGPGFEIRAGFNLARLGLFEDAARALGSALERLESGTLADVERRYLRVLGGFSLARVLDELGRGREARRVLEEAGRTSDPVARLLFEALEGQEAGQPFWVKSMDLRRFTESALAARQNGTLPELERAWRAVSPVGLPSPADGRREQIELLERLSSSHLENFFVDARDLAARRPKSDNLLSFLMTGSLALLRSGHELEAIELAAQAIDMLESQLAASRLGELTSSYIGHQPQAFGTYSFAIELAAIFGRDSGARAWSFAERGRAYELRRLLGRDREVAPETARSPAELAAGAAIADFEEGGDLGRARKVELYRSFEAARLHRRLAAPVQPAAEAGALAGVTLDGVERKREIVSSGELMFSYYQTVEPRGLFRLGPQEPVPPPFRGQLWLWGLHPDAFEQLRTGATERDRELIDCWVALLRSQPLPGLSKADGARGAELVASASCSPGGADPAEMLYRLLVSPGEHLLRAARRLVVIPHGRLHRVPFGALRRPGGRRLIESFELAVTPGAEVLTSLRHRAAVLAKRRPDSTLAPKLRPLVMGDPETRIGHLEAARQEAIAVAKLLGVEPLLGREASEAALWARAPQANLLHIAAHGSYEPDSPLFSAIHLAKGERQDGNLYVHEVWDRLDLRNVRLVVLSACDTAAGEPTRGDEILGLTQAFLVAGAPAVIATLWPVDDQASARLMTEFYRLFQQGATAAGALRQAQRLLMADPQTAAPYYWAGYTLVGDPDARWHGSVPGGMVP